MRHILTILIICSLASCSLIRREAGHPGGNIGYQADQRLIQASSYNQRVERYFISMAFLAPLLAATSQTGEEAKSSATAINGLYGSISAQHELLGLECAENAASCPLLTDHGTFAFETHTLATQRSLFRLSRQVVDNLNLKVNVNRLRGLSGTDLLRLTLKADRLVSVLMRYLATYRDMSVIMAHAMVAHCGTAGGVTVTDADGTSRSVMEHECNRLRGYVGGEFLNAISVNSNGDERYAISESLRLARQIAGAGFTGGWLQDEHHKGLIYHIDQVCSDLWYMQMADDVSDPVNCSGTALPWGEISIQASVARTKLFTAFGLTTVPPTGPTPESSN